MARLLALGAAFVGPSWLGLLALLALARYYGEFEGLSELELARRVARNHHSRCIPESAVLHDGSLRVSCAGGTSASFSATLPCESDFACDVLGFDAACWRP